MISPMTLHDMSLAGLVSCSVEVLQPFLLGCDTKNPKIVHQCLTSIQRLISHEAISVVSNLMVLCKMYGICFRTGLFERSVNKNLLEVFKDSQKKCASFPF